MTVLDAVDFAKALADETRQKIMKLCCCGWVSVTEIVDQLNVTQPTVSHHLAILRDSGLVNVRHEGKQTFYSLNQESVAVCCGQLMVKFAPEVKPAKTENETTKP
ncbi:MAG: metalloregulator ArsR/SmtB family transcription factor [Anaerolineales bacterium]